MLHQVDKFGKQNVEYKKQIVDGNCNKMPHAWNLTTHDTIISQ